jgi:hypothetical protein
MNPGTRVAMVAVWLFFVVDAIALAETTQFKVTIKGDTAVANFMAPDPADPCIQHFVTVVASDHLERVSPDGRLDEVRVELIVGQTNECLGITVFNGEGDVADPSFQFSLNSATLSAIVTVFDSISFQFYDFDINMSWVALGQPVFHNGKEKFHDKDLGLTIVSHMRGRHAAAEASGTVVGFGYNFTPKPSVGAELQTDNNGTIIIEKTTP